MIHPLAGNTAAVQDPRCCPLWAALGYPPSVVADATMHNGYASVVSLASGASFASRGTVVMEASCVPGQSLSTTYAMYAWCDINIPSWFTGGAFGSTDGLLPILCIDNSVNVSLQLAIRPTGPPSRYVAVCIDRALNVYLSLNENGTVTTTGALTSITAAHHDIELSVTFATGPHLQASLRIDQGTVHTFVSPNPTVAYSLRNARCGWLDNTATIAAGNGTGTLQFGNIMLGDSNSFGSYTGGWPLDLPAGTTGGPFAEVMLPNGDGATLQWLTHAGAAGTYTEWNDALGAWTGADATYNHPGAGAGPLSQESLFPATARGAADVIAGVELAAQSFWGVGLVNWSSTLFMLTETGLQTSKAVNEPDSATGAGFLQAMWDLSPRSSFWTPSLINTVLRTMQRTNANTADPEVLSFWQLNWYYAGAAAAGRTYATIF